MVLTAAAGIAPKRVRWFWAGRVAVGTLSLLAGREGMGKSTITYWMVAQITRGTLPGEDYGRPRSVIICATEDAWADVIVPRLIAAGADRSRVYRVEVETSLELTAELSLPRDIAGMAEGPAGGRRRPTGPRSARCRGCPPHWTPTGMPRSAKPSSR